MKKQEFLQVSQEVNIKKNFIQNFDNEEAIIKIKKAASQETELVIHNNRALVALTIAATFEALRKYPAGQELVLQLLMPDLTNPYQQFSIDAHKNQLIELGAHIQSEMKEQITKKTTDAMENRVSVQ